MLARRAHLAYFTELAETAEPHLRRAEQLDWLAILEAEHDNIAAAMRGALAAGEAAEAMRLAAAAGWYWWLGGHKTEGNELIMAAAAAARRGGRRDPGHGVRVRHELPDRPAGTATSTRRRSGSTRPTSSAAASSTRTRRWRSSPRWNACCRAPDAFAARVRTAARRRRPLGARAGPAAARQDADPARRGRPGRGRSTSRRRSPSSARSASGGGSSFALTELADRIAMRGEFAGACEHYEQAIAVVTEVGAIEDVVRMRSRQAQLYWLLGDEDAERVGHGRGAAARGTGRLAERAGRAGAGEGGARPLERRRRTGPPPARRRDGDAGRRPPSGPTSGR